MKLVHTNLNTAVLSDKYVFTEWIIESPKLYAYYLQELFLQQNGEEGRGARLLLEYHTFLHHSQTSNSKIKCYHRHKNKVLKLNYSINFTSVSIYNITHSSFHATSFMIFNK